MPLAVQLKILLAYYQKKMETCSVQSVSPQTAVGAFSPSGSNLCGAVVGILLLCALIYWLFSPSRYAVQMGQGSWRTQPTQQGLFGASQPHMIPHPSQGTASTGPRRDMRQPPARMGSSSAPPSIAEMSMSSEDGATSSPLSRSLQTPHLDDVEAEWFEGRRAWAVA